MTSILKGSRGGARRRSEDAVAPRRQSVAHAESQPFEDDEHRVAVATGDFARDDAGERVDLRVRAAFQRCKND